MYFSYPFGNIHIVTQPLDRKKCHLDFLYSTGGSWFEAPAHRGRKHLLEHCIASRTSDKNFEELKDFTFRENINLNAYTSDVVMGLNASGHAMDFEKMFTMLLEMFLMPTFDQSILNREKEVVLREISERRGDPNYRLYFDAIRQVYTPDSLEVHEILGDEKAVASTTLADFIELHQQNISQSHLFLMCSGGGIKDKTWIQNQLDTFFASHPEVKQRIASSAALPVNFKPPNQLQPFTVRPIVHPLAHQHAEISIFIPVTVSFDLAPVLVIFDNLFIKYGGTLHDILRDEKQMIYGINGVFRNEMNMLELQFSCEIKLIDEIISTILHTLTNPVEFLPQSKFDTFKLLLTKRIEIAADSLGSETKFISERLLRYGKAEDYASYIKRLNSVTYDDVLGVYKQISSNWNKKQIVITSNSEEIVAVADDIV